MPTELVGLHPPGQALDHQLAGVPAAVVADVHDQSFTLCRLLEIAMQLSPTGGHHVGDVQVAEPPLAMCLHMGQPDGVGRDKGNHVAVHMREPEIRTISHTTDASWRLRRCSDGW